MGLIVVHFAPKIESKGNCTAAYSSKPTTAMVFPRIYFFFIVHIGVTSSFDLGVKYVYRYETTVVSETVQKVEGRNLDKESIKYKIEAEVHMTPIWKKSEQGSLVKVEISKPELTTPSKISIKTQESVVQDYSSPAVYAYVVDGKVVKLFASSSDTPSSKNTKKALASTLQYSTVPREAAEADISGLCDVSYTRIHEKILKSKKNCISYKEDLRRLNPILGAEISRKSDMTYEMTPGENVFRVVTASDDLGLASSMWKSNKLSIISRFHLELKDVLPGAETISGADIYEAKSGLEATYKESLVEETLEPEILQSESSGKDKSLVRAVKSYMEYLRSEALSKVSSATAFLKLLKKFRLADKDAILDILKQKGLKSIKPQLLDIVAFSGTKASMEAAFDALDFAKDDPDLLERFLLSLSLTTHPDEELVNTLLEVLKKPVKSEKVKATLISTLGAICRTIRETRNDDESTQVEQSVLSFLEKGLKRCKSENCKLVYLRGFRNAALKSSVQLLSDVAVKGGSAALEALIALRNLGFHRSSSACERLAKNVFYELKSKQESSTRILAADLLLRCHPTNDTLRNLLKALADQKEPEFSTALTSRLLEEIERDDKLRSEVMQLLPEEDVKFYYSLSQKGTSSSLTKPMITTSEMATTYSIFMEMLPGGLLKRSSFDVNVGMKNESLHLLSVGTFASGIGSLAGTEDSEESPTAGMELTVLGVALRPYVFFEGTSELMGHAWSGTASEPTSALQGNFLITDVEKNWVLQNGQAVRLELYSVMSVDLSASIQISLWNRNSHSEVKNGAALLVIGSAKLRQGPLRVEDSFTLKGQTSVDFTTDFEFYETPFKTCLQMTQPEYTFWSQKKSSVSSETSKFSQKRSRTRKWLIPSKSFSLHKKNNEICASIFR